MLELRNSKKTELSRAKDGQRRYAIDGFIGAIQMLDPLLGWQDIKPRLVRDLDGWHIEGAPYYAEVKDNGDRLFCPDKYERSKYIRLPVIPLFSGLTRTAIAQATKLDGSLLASKIAMPTSYGSVNFDFTNTGMYLPLILNSAPTLASKTVDCLTLDIDSTFDIQKLIDSKSGFGILPGYIMDASKTYRKLEWTYKSGQLELGFDLTGLKFPVTLMDAIDIDIAAGADDAYTESLYETSRLTETGLMLDMADRYCQTFLRFIDVAIAASDTIDHAYIALRANQNPASNSSLRIIGLAESNAGALTNNYATMIGRTETTAYVDWTAGAWDWNGVYGYLTDAQDIAAIITEIKGLVGWGTGNALVIKVKNLTQSVTRSAASYETGEGYEVPHFHADITAGGGAIVEIASESIGLTESDTHRAYSIRPSAEGIGLTEGSVRRMYSNRLISDVISITESLIKRAYSNRLISEVIGITESFIKRTYSNRFIAETVGVLDSAIKTTFTLIVKLMSEALGMTESLIRRAYSNRIMTEIISVTDLMINTGKAILVKIMSETLGIIEVFVKRLRPTRIIRKIDIHNLGKVLTHHDLGYMFRDYTLGKKRREGGE